MFSNTVKTYRLEKWKYLILGELSKFLIFSRQLGTDDKLSKRRDDAKGPGGAEASKSPGPASERAGREARKQVRGKSARGRQRGRFGLVRRGGCGKARREKG